MSPTVTLDRELVHLAVMALKQSALIVNAALLGSKDSAVSRVGRDQIAGTMTLIKMLEDAAAEPVKAAKPFSGPGVE